MKRIEKCFGSINMTWKKVILFALITAVYTALMALIPWFDDTSLSDIAVTLECWVLFAILIAVNCGTWYESALKVFVFFLISQPLIYLFQVPFSRLGWGIFQYYKYWFKITLLTLPGGAVAFFVKKQNWLSALILSVATSLLASIGVSYTITAIKNFPHHIISAVFCFALAVFLIIILLKNYKLRLVAFLLTFLVMFYMVALEKRKNTRYTYVIDLPEGEWDYVLVQNDFIAEIIIDGNHVKVEPKNNGESELVFFDDNGNYIHYYVTVSDGYLGVSPLD